MQRVMQACLKKFWLCQCAVRIDEVGRREGSERDNLVLHGRSNEAVAYDAPPSKTQVNSARLTRMVSGHSISECPVNRHVLTLAAQAVK